MKNILFLVLGLGMANFAQAAQLKSLNCMASNGVTIAGSLASNGSVLDLKSQWGLLTKNFTASADLVQDPSGNSTIDLLDDANTVAYRITLAKPASPAPANIDSSAAFGKLEKVNSGTESSTLFLAGIQCDLDLAN